MFWQSSTEKVQGETSVSQATNSSPLGRSAGNIRASHPLPLTTLIVSATAGNLSSEPKPGGETSAKVKVRTFALKIVREV